jgi:hypothetical protein
MVSPRLLPLLQLLHPNLSVRPPDDVDWKHVLTPNLNFRFGALISSQSEHKRVRLPEELKVQFKQTSRSQGLRSIMLKAILSKVLNAFAREKIDCCVLKGSHLALLVYPAANFRFSCDIDLLIRESDLSAATQCLEKLGFVQRNPEMEIIDHDHHLVFDSEKFPIPIELHWKLHSPAHRVGDAPLELWSEFNDGQLMGAPVKLMTTEQMVVYLSSHATRHSLDQGPVVLIDLAYLIEFLQGDLNWPKIQETAKAWNAETSLALVLASLRWMRPELTPETVGGRVIEPEMSFLALEEMWQPETLDERRARTVITLSYLPPGAEAIARQYPQSKPGLASKLLWLRDRLGALIKNAWPYLHSSEQRNRMWRRVRLERCLDQDLNHSKLPVWALLSNPKRLFQRLLTFLRNKSLNLPGTKGD